MLFLFLDVSVCVFSGFMCRFMFRELNNTITFEICLISVFTFLILYDIISKSVLRCKINVFIFDFHASHFLKIFKRINFFFQLTNRDNEMSCSCKISIIKKNADFRSVTHCLCAIWESAGNVYGYVCYAHTWLTCPCAIFYTRKRTHAETYIIYCV